MLSEDYQPFACAKIDRLQNFFNDVLAKFLMRLPVKVCALVEVVKGRYHSKREVEEL